MARPARTGITRCPGCDELTIKALLDGAIITLDRLPDPQGLIAAEQGTLGTWTARRHTPGTAIAAGIEHVYAVHDCGAETAQEPPAGIAFIAAYQKGVSGHRAQQRTARSTTRQPGVGGRGGYRAWPGGQR